MDKVVRGVENLIHKPKIKISDQETEAPTYEVEFLRDYRNIMEAWEAAEKKLIRMTAAHMKNRPSIKLSLGCRFQVVKSRFNADNDDLDTVEVIEETPVQKRFIVKNIQIYNVESVKPIIKNLKSEMERGFYKTLDNLGGSNWAVKRIDSLFAVTHTQKAARGSSYIPTPEKPSKLEMRSN